MFSNPQAFAYAGLLSWDTHPVNFPTPFLQNPYASFRSQIGRSFPSGSLPSECSTHTHTRLAALDFPFKCSNPPRHDKLPEGRDTILLIMPDNRKSVNILWWLVSSLNKPIPRVSANCSHIKLLLTIKKVNRVLRKEIKCLEKRSTCQITAVSSTSKVK